VAAGCAIPSFGTDALGVVGVLVGLGRGDGTSGGNHSIFSISKLILDMTEFLTSIKELIGLLSIAVLLVATTLVIPIAVVVAQLVRWFFALKNQAARNRLDVAIECLEAWQYIEVYVLTILLGIWQLGDVSEHMMNKYCGNLSAMFAEMAHFDILAEEDAQCFKLQPSVQAGSYILLSAAVVLSVLRTWMTLAIRQVNLQQVQQQQQRAASSMEFGTDVGVDSVKGDVSVLIKEIAPAPVLLTDRFRWVMVQV
jgi:Paraquat-inducible protein A